MAETPLSPHRVRGARENDLPAYVGNGLVGLRIREVPLLAGACIVSGVVGLHPDDGLEAAISVPYPLGGDIGVGEAWLSEQPWSAGELEQQYDFATGELSSMFVVRMEDVALRAKVVTFASRTNPALVLQQVELTSDQPCAVRLRATIAIADARGHATERDIGEGVEVGDGAMLWRPEGEMSCCGIAYHSRCVVAEGEPQFRQKYGSGPLTTEYRVGLKPGKAVRIEHITALISSASHHRPKQEAVRHLAQGILLGFEKLRMLNREDWSHLWRSRITVDGASRAHQRLIDAGFFYLNSSAHLSSPAATSMFGLASWPNYNYYYGHVMWDIDAFCVPPLLLIQPDAARSLLDFRARRQDAAWACAKLHGHRGLRFPWEAAPLSGEEASPGAGSAAVNAAHVSLHVARALPCMPT